MTAITEETGSRPKQRGPSLLRGRNMLGILVIVAVLVFGLRWLLGDEDTSAASDTPTFAVASGDLVISVIEGGNLKALKSKEIKSEVEGSATILYIVPEGTRITEKDIADKKLLVELDSSQIRERTKTQEITYQSANSDYIQAKEAYQIQLKQNESDIKAGELSVKFALMDLQRYLGKGLASQLTQNHEALFKPGVIGNGEQDSGSIEGASRQTKRTLENSISLSREELTRAQNDLEWTDKLYEKGFVSKNDLDADTLALNRRKVELEQSKTALDLFLQYEFYKEAEKLLSDYEEAIQQLERTKARARAQEAQKKSSLEATRAKYELQQDRLAEYKEQVEKCTIYATTPGLVVWSNRSDGWGREQNRIEEGASVRQRQSIVMIPDISTMAVEVKVHETAVDRVKRDLKARIKVDALSDLVFDGQVLKIGVLPDTQSRWLNPDLKVYSTDVSVLGDHDFLKPGMSAQVEIIIKELNDVLYVPIQAVLSRQGENFCMVQPAGQHAMPQRVITGEYNDTFVEIREGLSEGDLVLVRPTPSDWEPLELNGNGNGHQREGESGPQGERPGTSPGQRPGPGRERAMNHGQGDRQPGAYPDGTGPSPAMTQRKGAPGEQGDRGKQKNLSGRGHGEAARDSGKTESTSQKQRTRRAGFSGTGESVR